MHQRINETTKQGINESKNQRIKTQWANDSVNQGVNDESMNQRVNEQMNQWLNHGTIDSVNQQ